VRVQLIQLETLLSELEGKSAFINRYPGAFMIAAGLLRAEELGPCQPTADEEDAAEERLIIAPTKPPRDSSRARLDFTSVYRFGQRLIHATGEPHALAGSAFHLRPDGGASPDVLVGRAARCDITVPDSSVSEEHCRIEVTDRGVVVVDLGSTNGTSINQRRIEPRAPEVLADEDIVAVGRYSFQLLSSASLYEGLVQVRPLLEQEKQKKE
jgi:hypothetical protein